MIGIKGINIDTSGERVPIRDLPEFQLLPPDQISYFEGCGINTVNDASPDSAFDLARRASRNLLDESGTDPEDIQVLIYIAPRVPGQMISSEVTRLQFDLGLDGAQVFSMGGLGCADSSMALKLARDLIKANRSYRNILIAYGNKKYARSRLRYPVTVTGDGGMAVLVARQEENAILDVAVESNGKYWDLFKMDFRDKQFPEYEEVCSDLRSYGFELALESRNRFRDLNERLLQANGLEKAEIDHFLLQNISQKAFQFYNESLEININQVCQHNLHRFGHLGCADVLANYKSGIESGQFKEGDYVVIMNNSPVAAWSSILIKV